VGVALGKSDHSFTVAFSALIAATLIYIWVLRDRPVFLTAAFLIWLSIERLVTAGISPILDSGSLSLLLAYKEVFFPALLLIFLPRLPTVWRHSAPLVRTVDLLAVAFGVTVVVGFVLSDAPTAERLINARRLAILPLVYGAFRLAPWRRGDARSVVWLIVVAAASLGIFGLLELTVAEDLVWRDLVPAAYYYHLATQADLTASGTNFPISGLPIIFFDFNGQSVDRRLVSTFLEPTALASFLSFSTVVALASWPTRVVAWLAAIVIGLAALMTLGKAGIVIGVVGGAYLSATAFIPRFGRPAWLLSLTLGLLGALVVAAIALQSTGEPHGMLAHFRGLKDGLEAVLDNPLGHGVGIGGNFGLTQLAAESTIGVIGVQVGLVGIILWTVWLLGLAMVTLTNVRSQGYRLLAVATSAMLVAFFGTAAFTESAGGFMGNWVFALLPAVLLAEVGEQPEDIQN
jgi:hypothetical protein